MRTRFIRYFIPVLALALCATDVSATPRGPVLTARAAVIVDSNGGVLYSKNPHLRLPPASTTKIMTAILVLERLRLDQNVTVGAQAVNVSPSKAGLTQGAQYKVKDLLVAMLVASSNDAAVALAERVAGSEKAFAKLMNEKAAAFGMRNTRFVNATGLTDRRKAQYSTAYDLTILMRRALKDRRIDLIMGFTTATITGSDGKPLVIKSHNKMLWRRPGLVKGKTGWTFASRHTFVGTNYSPQKMITFAMLSSHDPWVDIERLAKFGMRAANRR